MSDVVIYEGSADWSAVYLDGRLQRVGDHYLAAEWVNDHFGVKVIQSDDFLRGGQSRVDVAALLSEAEAYGRQREERSERAAELRNEANRLLAEAAGLEAAS